MQHPVDHAAGAVQTAESISMFRIMPGEYTEMHLVPTPSLKSGHEAMADAYTEEPESLYAG
ncbi:hypothetical protein [Streptomyces sulphureus]|uniref:hypothetical protein n=1 Tax=Streptomyces sulphureus TaxID=47758 RepID=UPI0003742343|nr:hypothetical protein [Streptomyces sulphureus]